jgi:hypothetical protein
MSNASVGKRKICKCIYFGVIQNVRKEYKTYIFLEMFRLVTYNFCNKQRMLLSSFIIYVSYNRLKLFYTN